MGGLRVRVHSSTHRKRRVVSHIEWESPLAAHQAFGIEKLAPLQACVGLLDNLQLLANPGNVAGMARFGISPNAALGVSMTTLRVIARPIMRARKPDGAWRHSVAAGLWRSEIHEARLLACLLDDPALVTREQALAWASDSDSWDITDQLCLNLLDRTDFAYELTLEWSNAPGEFVKKSVNWALRGIGKRSQALHGPALDAARRLTESRDRTARWIGRDAVRELDGTPVRKRLGLA